MNAHNFSNQIHSLLVVCSDTSSESIVDELAALSSRYKAHTIAIAEANHYEPKEAPELIVADLSELTDDQLETLEGLRKRFKDVPVILVSEGLTDEQIRKLFRLQIDDWLRRPLNKKQFNNALLSALQSSRGTQSKVHGILSAAGGVGATTVAISTAALLAERSKSSGKSVALFDLDFSMGNCGYALNASSNYNLETVIDNPSRIDAEFIDIIKKRHDRGFNIYSFKRPDIVSASTGAELVLRMLDAVSLIHDYTVVDIPHYHTPWRDEVIGAVNSITIVSYLSLPVIKHTQELLQAIRSQVAEMPPTRVVFNKRQSRFFGNTIKSKNIEKLFKRVHMAEFADDRSILEESLNRGILPSEINARSRFLKDLSKHIDDFVLEADPVN